MNTANNEIDLEYFDSVVPSYSQTEALPFYIKEIGFSSSRKFVRGMSNNYNEYLILYALGTMRFTKHHSGIPVGENDVIFSSCNAPITVQSPRGSHVEYMYIVVGGQQIQYFYNLVRKSNYLFHTNPLSGIRNHFLRLLETDFEGNLLLAQMEAGSTIYQLLLELYKLSKSILEIKKITPVQDSAVTTAIKYIHENYKSDLDIDTICDKVSFSKYYFCKLFKEHTNMTVHQYVTEYRINKSKELLSYSKMSIGNVAAAVGFKSVLTFSRCFERQMHMTPSEYRRLY